MARTLAAAVSMALVALSFYTSTATLLFQGELASFIPLAVGAVTLGGSLLTLATSWKGSLPAASSGLDSATVPLLGAMTASVMLLAPANAALPTVLVALLLVGICVSAAWMLAGRFQAGDLIRNIPHPVVGGFMASSGWLMATGGMGVSAGFYFKLAQAPQWLHQHFDLRVAVGLLIGVVMVVIVKSRPYVFLLPWLIVGFLTLLHLGLWMAGMGIEEARAQGWLLPAFEPDAAAPARRAQAGLGSVG